MLVVPALWLFEHVLMAGTFHAHSISNGQVWYMLLKTGVAGSSRLHAAVITYIVGMPAASTGTSVELQHLISDVSDSGSDEMMTLHFV